MPGMWRTRQSPSAVRARLLFERLVALSRTLTIHHADPKSLFKTAFDNRFRSLLPEDFDADGNLKSQPSEQHKDASLFGSVSSASAAAAGTRSRTMIRARWTAGAPHGACMRHEGIGDGMQDVPVDFKLDGTGIYLWIVVYRSSPPQGPLPAPPADVYRSSPPQGDLVAPTTESHAPGPNQACVQCPCPMCHVRITCRSMLSHLICVLIASRRPAVCKRGRGNTGRGAIGVSGV